MQGPTKVGVNTKAQRHARNILAITFAYMSCKPLAESLALHEQCECAVGLCNIHVVHVQYQWYACAMFMVCMYNVHGMLVRCSWYAYYPWYACAIFMVCMCNIHGMYLRYAGYDRGNAHRTAICTAKGRHHTSQAGCWANHCWGPGRLNTKLWAHMQLLINKDLLSCMSSCNHTLHFAASTAICLWNNHVFKRKHAVQGTVI